MTRGLGWRAAMALGLLAGRLAAAAPEPEAATARFTPETDLITNGSPAATLVMSATDPEAAEAARQLGAGMQARLGVAFPAATDVSLCPQLWGPLPAEVRGRNLIVVGNLHNNRLVFPLYAEFFCGADSLFPGGTGYELRTISNPWGTGRNVILVGGSTPAGLRAGAAALLEALPSATAARVTVPRLHAIVPGGDIRAKLEAVARRLPDAGFRRPANAFEADPGLFAGPALRYHWTGDARWAERARAALLYFNEIYNGSYLSDMEHYTAESFVRAWDLVEESPVFTEAERQATARRMLQTGWRWNGGLAAGGGPGIGHLGNTHGTMIMMTKWTATRYLQRTFAGDPGASARLARAEADLRDHYHMAAGGFLDDSHGIASLGSFLRWSVSARDPIFLETGAARQGLLYAATYYDPLGYMAGIGMYGEARPGAMRGRSSYWCEAYLFRLAAVLFQDPELAMLGGRFAEFGPVDVWPVMTLSDYGAGSYPPPPGLKPRPPTLPAGLSLVPFDARRYRLWNTGAPTRGIPAGQRMPIRERMFDKLCFRTGFAAQDQYLLLQGLQPETEDANTIARFTDRGQLWLTHNSAQEGHFVRNGLFLSDGLNDRRIQSGCRLDAAGRFDDLSMISSTLPDFYESDWQRAVFWRPGRWFAVLDRAVLARAGQFAVQSIWRLPPIPGAWDAGAGRLTARQHGQRFGIQSADRLPASAAFEMPTGGMPDIYENPFILRETQSGRYAARRALTFQHLLAVTDAAEPENAYALERLGETAALVRGPDNDVCLIGMGGVGERVLGLDTDAGLFALTPSNLFLAGARMVFLDGTNILEAARPVSARVDMRTGDVRAGFDQDDLRQAASTWVLKSPAAGRPDWKTDKPRDLCGILAERLAAAARERPALASPAAGERVPAPRPATPGPAPLVLVWESREAGSLGRPPAGLDVMATPGATRGEPGDLVNRIVPGQGEGVAWPGAEAVVELSWRQIESIAEIRIHGGLAGRRGQPALPRAGDRPVTLAWDPGATSSPARVETRLADLHIRMDPSYKGESWAYRYWTVLCGGARAAGVRVTVPRATNDTWSGIGISEIEVLTTNRGPLDVDQVVVADLGWEGGPGILVSTTERRLTALGPDGKTRWSKSLSGRLPSVIAADLGGDGRPAVLASCYDQRVYAWDADGRERWTIDCSDLYRQSGGKTGQNGSTPYAVGFWEPRPGVRRLLVGQYAGPSVLLDERGTLLGYTGLGGYTPRRYFGPADLNGDGLSELCLYSILYRGGGTICPHGVDRDGQPVSPARQMAAPGGAPFAAQFLRQEPGCAAVIAPGGAGVYDLNVAAHRHGGANARWESLGRPVSAGLVHDTDGDGREDLLVGGRDGFLTVFSADGVPQRTVLVGEDVKGIQAFGSGTTLASVVATPGGLRVYDAQWIPQGAHADAYAGLVAYQPDQRRFLAVTEDARVQLWQLPEGRRP